MQSPPDKANNDKEDSTLSNESKNKPSTPSDESVIEDTGQNLENDDAQ